MSRRRHHTATLGMLVVLTLATHGLAQGWNPFTRWDEPPTATRTLRPPIPTLLTPAPGPPLATPWALAPPPIAPLARPQRTEAHGWRRTTTIGGPRPMAIYRHPNRPELRILPLTITPLEVP